MSAPPTHPGTRKVFIKTYGCQMNVYDSERMADTLAAEGYAPTDRPDQADLILLNTCHIREKAAEKVYSDLGRLKPLKAANPALKIGVAGCVAQAEGAEILARAPVVDLVVGPQTYHRLPAMLRRVAEGERALDTDFPPEDKFDHLPAAPRAARGPTAFLTIQEGCDKFCAFCVVPYTRGSEVSRPAARILAEARALADRGVREITLLGQNVNAYHGAGEGGTWSLARLLSALSEIPGLARLRYTTSHPNDVTDDLIAAHGRDPKVMPYLHLPVQSGSDRILKAMNRKHTAAQYLALVARLRAARPDLALGSDFIVGFPGEDEGAFQATLDLAAAVGFASAFCFAYSPRPGTPAAERPAPPAEVVLDRLHRLQALLARQAQSAQAAMVGRIVPVLFEKPGRRPGQMAGKSDHLMAVHIEAEGALAPRVGEVRAVRITAQGGNSLSGALAD